MRRFEWFVVGVAAGGALVGVVARLVWVSQAGLKVDWPATFSAISDIAQTLALVTAGVWTYRLFIKQRTDRIRAEVTLSATVVARGAASVLVRAVLEIKNVGNVELCPHKAYVHVQDIRRANGLLNWPAKPGGSPYAPHQSVEKWPEVTNCELELHAGDQLTLEPGEIERYPIDFTVPADLAIVQLRAIVRADADENNGTYWDETIVVAIQERERAPRIEPANDR